METVLGPDGELGQGSQEAALGRFLLMQVGSHKGCTLCKSPEPLTEWARKQIKHPEELVNRQQTLQTRDLAARPRSGLRLPATFRARRKQLGFRAEIHAISTDFLNHETALRLALWAEFL